MDNLYQEEQLRGIAEECQEFEHVISAMGYGFSMLNVAPERFLRRCPDCVHWLGGSCNIFLHEKAEWGGQ